MKEKNVKFLYQGKCLILNDHCENPNGCFKCYHSVMNFMGERIKNGLRIRGLGTYKELNEAYLDYMKYLRVDGERR